MGNFETFPSQLCSPCRFFPSVCRTRSSPHLNSLTNAFIAPRSTIQGITIHPKNFISPLQQKAFPPATPSRLPPPPPWTICSLVSEDCLLPPLWPTCSPVNGIANIVTTQATLTPPGLITGKATGHSLIAGTMNPATTQAISTLPGLITGKGTGRSMKAWKENLVIPALVQAFIIWRQMMVKQKAHKAAAAAAQAAKDIQFKAFQQELGLLLDNDGKESAPSTPQKAAARRPVVRSPQQHDGGHKGNKLLRWNQTPLPLPRYPLSPLTY
jgi:hypothetical protein